MPTTCQICGRAIKTTRGYHPRHGGAASETLTGKMDLIALHGYRRPGHGWQTASCYGAKWRPYEVACDALPPAIEGIKGYIERTQVALDRHNDTPPHGLEVPPRGMYERNATRSVLRPADFNPDKPDYRPDSYVTLYLSRRRVLESQLKSARDDLRHMETRLADWKPAQCEAA